jgi:hypothetical protein
LQFYEENLVKLKRIANEILLSDLKIMVGKERELLRQVIEYLAEVETRKLHLEEGYSSMFSFCTEYLNYTPQEAQTRIQAMRLSKAVPEIKEQIQNGELSLSVAATVQSHIQRENKIKKCKQEQLLNLKDKRKIVEAVKGSSFRKAESILVEIFPHHAEMKPERVKEISSSTMRLELNLSREVFDRLVKIKNLRKSQSFEELVAGLTELAEKKWDLTQKKTISVSKIKPIAAPLLLTSTVEQEKIKVGSRYIPIQVRRRIWKRDRGECQYKNQRSGHKCGSKFNLHIDHVRPFALDGGHSAENLRLLCAAHNGYRAGQTFGHW